MGIPLSQLQRAANTQYAPPSVSVASAKILRRRVAFLCHSHKDADLVKGLVAMLHAAGFAPYVDWQDHELPAKPDRRTAEKIQTVIREADMFLFLATPNSVSSRWCPWEIGYADGARRGDGIFIVPTLDATGTEYGNEYLSLYRRIDTELSGGLKYYEPGEQFASRAVANL